MIWDLRFGSGGRLDGMGAVEMVIAGGLCVIVIGWPGLSAIRKVLLGLLAADLGCRLVYDIVAAIILIVERIENCVLCRARSFVDK